MPAQQKTPISVIEQRLVRPEFLSSDDPARVFHDTLRLDVNKHLAQMQLSYRDSALGLAYMLAEVISHHPSKDVRGPVAQRLHELVIDLADEMAELRKAGILS